jgi:hypothetical protein
MADRLGCQVHLDHQKLKKEYLAGPSLSMPWLSLSLSLASSRMGQTCPKTSFYPSFLKFFVKKRVFLPLARFLVPKNHVF